MFRLSVLCYLSVHSHRRVGLFLTAILVLIVLNAFTFAPHAYASGGSCWSDNTWSTNANVGDTGTPEMFQIKGSSGPALGLRLNNCQRYIQIKWSDRGYDYYKVDWLRPGLNAWKEFRVSGQSYDDYMYYTFKGINFRTYYNFAVKGCISHWYGDRCDDWSPTVGIHT